MLANGRGAGTPGWQIVMCVDGGRTSDQFLNDVGFPRAEKGKQKRLRHTTTLIVTEKSVNARQRRLKKRNTLREIRRLQWEKTWAKAREILEAFIEVLLADYEILMERGEEEESKGGAKHQLAPNHHREHHLLVPSR